MDVQPHVKAPSLFFAGRGGWLKACAESAGYSSQTTLPSNGHHVTLFRRVAIDSIPSFFRILKCCCCCCCCCCLHIQNRSGLRSVPSNVRTRPTELQTKIMLPRVRQPHSQTSSTFPFTSCKQHGLMIPPSSSGRANILRRERLGELVRRRELREIASAAPS